MAGLIVVVIHANVSPEAFQESCAGSDNRGVRLPAEKKEGNKKSAQNHKVE